MKSQAQTQECSTRENVLKRVRTAVERIGVGRPTKSVIIVGRRGVGKTALLDLLFDEMEHQAQCAYLHAMELRSLPSILAPALHLALLRMSGKDAAKPSAIRGLRALAGFSRAMNAKFADLGGESEYEPEAGLADNGDLDSDLTALLIQVGATAKAADTAFIVFVDDVQYIEESELAALISALHRVSQLALPVILVGAALPVIRERAGNARSYAERLFDFPEIKPIDSADIDECH